MRKKVAAGALTAAAIGASLWLWSARGHIGMALDVWRAAKATPTALAARQRERLAELVAFARARSPYYRALYCDLPEATSNLSALPIVTKPDLMAHFDEWVTDPAVTLSGVEAFVADPALIGKRYLGRYVVWTTSGTTGKPGIFVHDRRAMWVYRVIVPLRGYRWLTPQLFWHLVRRGRFAVLVATGGHFAVLDWFEQVRRRWDTLPILRKRIRIFSVLAPLGNLVRELNEFQPTLLLGYPSITENGCRIHGSPSGEG